MKGVATTIEDLSTALSLADQNGMSVEEKRKLKKKVCVFSTQGRGVFVFTLERVYQTQTYYSANRSACQICNSSAVLVPHVVYLRLTHRVELSNAKIWSTSY